MNVPPEVTAKVNQLAADYYLDHLTPCQDYKDGFLACWAWVSGTCVPRVELERLQALVDHWYTQANQGALK